MTEAGSGSTGGSTSSYRLEASVLHAASANFLRELLALACAGAAASELAWQRLDLAYSCYSPILHPFAEFTAVAPASDIGSLGKRVGETHKCLAGDARYWY